MRPWAPGNSRGGAARAPSAGDGTTTAGSRLVPLSYRGSDGSKTFAGVFDKQLGKECAFERLGAIGVCVPSDVYTVSSDVFYDSLKNDSPALYTDPQCEDRKAIAIDAQTECASYGVIRITGSPYANDAPACGAGNYGSGLAVITPVPAGTKLYAWGQGGGQCCTCAEWVPPPSGTFRAYYVETSPEDADTAGIELVTAVMDDPKTL